MTSIKKNTKDRKRRYHLKNREKLLAYKKEWRNKNKDKIRESHKEWRKINREKLSKLMHFQTYDLCSEQRTFRAEIVIYR